MLRLFEVSSRLVVNPVSSHDFTCFKVSKRHTFLYIIHHYDPGLQPVCCGRYAV
jgi:hypothetical protein